MAPPPPRPTAHSPCLLLAVPPSPLSTGRGFHRGETSYHFCLLINLNFQDDYPLKQRSLAAAPRVPGGGRGASPATTTSKGAGLGRPPGGKNQQGRIQKGPCAWYQWPSSAGGSRDLLEVAPKCERIQQHQGICHPPASPKSHPLPARS